MVLRYYLSLRHPDRVTVDDLDRALATLDIGCVDLPLGGVEPRAWRRVIDGLLPTVQAGQSALIVSGLAADAAARLVAAAQLDGVRSDVPPDVERTPVAGLRRMLDPDAIIVAAAGVSRHAAMLAGEDGADAVMLGDPAAAEETLTTVEWWADLMTIPSIATGLTTPDAVNAAADRGADFVDLGALNWREPETLAALRRPR